MIDSVLALARPAIAGLKAYSSARSLTTSGSVFLDANESPWGDFNRYPEPQPLKLRAALSELYRVPEEAIFLGRGTDEAIDVIVRTFCEAGRDAILICPPTYGVYEVAANIQGAGIVTVLQSAANGFQIDAPSVLEACTPAVKIIFLCSPNNPTGNCLPEATLEAIAAGLAERAVLVIDEAYIEFSDRSSFCRRLPEFANVVVLRTLSKAWGLAGARCGVALAHPKLISLLQKVRAPYPISVPSATVALEALAPERKEQADKRKQTLLRERDSLRQKLNRLSFVEQVFPSDANFLLLKVKDASRVMTVCRSYGVVVRDRSQDPGLHNCVRITVGSEEENALLLNALEEIA